MYNLIAQLAAPAITLLIIPAIFGVPGQAGPIPQEDSLSQSRYRVANGVMPPLETRKREAEAATQVAARSANPNPPVLVQRDASASILVSLPKREPAPEASGSNVKLQPKKRGGYGGGCGGGGCGGGCGGRGWGW